MLRGSRPAGEPKRAFAPFNPNQGHSALDLLFGAENCWFPKVVGLVVAADQGVR
jgi:hypothetical protein